MPRAVYFNESLGDILLELGCRCWGSNTQIRRVSRRQYCAIYKFIYLLTYLQEAKPVSRSNYWPRHIDVTDRRRTDRQRTVTISRFALRVFLKSKTNRLDNLTLWWMTILLFALRLSCGTKSQSWIFAYRKFTYFFQKKLFVNSMPRS